MRRHLLLRLGFFGLGLVLLYAPAALLVRAALAATGSTLAPDVHRICLRMPFEWLSQPWMYGPLLRQPLMLVALVLLPLVAVLFGPVFCGWLCPAGGLTEHLGRLVPDRLKLHPGPRLPASAIRYGVLAGMLLAPWTGGYVCCSFCNFTMAQNVVLAATGDFAELTTWTSFTLATFVVWFFVLGLFVAGGRGWCNLLCPAGALQGLAHALAARLPFARAIRREQGRCEGCRRCEQVCHAWAIERGRVSLHGCTACGDCLAACPEGTLRYGTPGAPRTRLQVVPSAGAEPGAAPGKLSA